MFYSDDPVLDYERYSNWCNSGKIDLGELHSLEDDVEELKIKKEEYENNFDNLTDEEYYDYQDVLEDYEIAKTKLEDYRELYEG